MQKKINSRNIGATSAAEQKKRGVSQYKPIFAKNDAWAAGWRSSIGATRNRGAVEAVKRRGWIGRARREGAWEGRKTRLKVQKNPDRDLYIRLWRGRRPSPVRRESRSTERKTLPSPVEQGSSMGEFFRVFPVFRAIATLFYVAQDSGCLAP